VFPVRHLPVSPALLFACSLACSLPACAQTYTEIDLAKFCFPYSADCPSGDRPAGALVQGSDGNFYGTTFEGGIHAGGTVFQLTSAGKYNVLYSFCSTGGSTCSDGATPSGSLIEGSPGEFYGLTEFGGANDSGNGGAGTAFKISSTGSFTLLHSFCAKTSCTDGVSPQGNLVMTDGNFFGVTSQGGANADGTVFEMTPAGAVTVLHSFAGASDGEFPSSGLTVGPGTSLYGTAETGGSQGDGTLFTITTGGSFTYLHSFCSQPNCADGSIPNALLYASDGSIYGTTYSGGANNDGIVFKSTTGGSITPLYSFCSTGGMACTDGANPYGALIQAADGTIYGTTSDESSFTSDDGPDLGGTLFTVTSSGSLTTLYTFCSGGVTTCLTGYDLTAGVIQGEDENFYGTAHNGEEGDGGVFKLSSSGSSKTATTVALSATPNPAYVGQNVAIKATVTKKSGSGTPTGNVVFSLGSTTLATVALNGSGVASFTASSTGYPAGTYAITGSYSGDSSDAASSVNYNVVLKAATATTTTLTASPTSVTPPADVTLTAKVTGTGGTPTGSVTFSTGGTVIGSATLSSGTATLKASTSGIPAGAYSITAKYGGSTEFASSTSKAAKVTVK
jgi:uncharacterized repeat protein (TIGR03803 family)